MSSPSLPLVTRELADVGGAERAPPPPDFAKLAGEIAAALELVDKALAERPWLADPERRKALSRSRHFLQRIQGRIEDPAVAALPGLPVAATTALVGRVKQTKLQRDRDDAWDFAEDLRIAALQFEPDDALHCRLAKEKGDRTSISWETVFSDTTMLEQLLTRPENFRALALQHLRLLHDERVDRVRHDRARERLLQRFVLWLIPVAYSGFLVCLFFTEPRPLLAVAAGAIGSLLSAIFNLRDGAHRIRTLRRTATFVTLQPLIGATAALALVWLGVHERIDISEAAVGFLAGYSEPFFLGTLGKLADLGGSGGATAPATPRVKANS